MNSILHFLKIFGPEFYTIYYASHSFSAWNSSVIVQLAFHMLLVCRFRSPTFFNFAPFCQPKRFKQCKASAHCAFQNKSPKSSVILTFEENFVKSTELVINHPVKIILAIFFQNRPNFSYFSTYTYFTVCTKNFSTLLWTSKWP